MNIMYIRVSSLAQNTARQEELAIKEKMDKVFIDKCSGKNADRPALKEMLNFVREGDVVYVHSISRLARNVKDLLSIVEELTSKKVQFVSLKENIDTSSSTGKFILTIFAALSELERETILSNQAEGIALAKERGVYKGRAPMKYDREKFKFMVEEVKNKKRKAVSVMKEFNITAQTYYRWIKQI